MEIGELFLDTYYVRKKLRTINQMIDVYEVAYYTKDKKANAILFVPIESEQNTKNGSRAVQMLFEALKEQDESLLPLASSFQVGHPYLILKHLPKSSAKPSSGSSSSASTRDTNDSTYRVGPVRLMFYLLGIILFMVLFVFAIVKLTSQSSIGGGSGQKQTEKNQTVVMKNFVGTNINAVIEQLGDMRLYYQIIYEDSDQIEKDCVIRQSVDGGETIAHFTIIQFVVSNGPKETEPASKQDGEEPTTNKSDSGSASKPSGSTSGSYVQGPAGSCIVPDLKNEWESNLASILAAKGLTLGNVYYELNSDVEHGRAFHQSIKPGDSVAEKTAIDVWIAISH